jgi:transposase-like protein
LTWKVAVVIMEAMKPYSKDLRLRIVKAVRDGMPKAVAARLFGVSLSSVKRYARAAERGHRSRRERAVEGAITAAVFKIYVEEVLAPKLRPGQAMVMDNLSTHKGERIRKLVEERGYELLYLPSYSPDLNPIEEAFRAR